MLLWLHRFRSCLDVKSSHLWQLATLHLNCAWGGTPLEGGALGGTGGQVASNQCLLEQALNLLGFYLYRDQQIPAYMSRFTALFIILHTSINGMRPP